MSGEGIREGCSRCGRMVVTDTPRVGISFTPDEVAQLARDTTSPALQARLLCALGTVDRDLEDHARAALLSDADGCPSCAVLVEQVATLEGERDELCKLLDSMDASAWERGERD